MRAASGVGGVCLCQARRHGVLGHSRWRGHGLFQPLDSSLRWNDGKESLSRIHRESRKGRQNDDMAIPVSRRHSGEGRNPGGGSGCWRCTGGVRLRQIGKYGVLGCHPRLRGHGLFQPLDSGLRRNDGAGDRYILAIFNGIPCTLSFDLLRARIAGLFMPCRSFWLSATFLNPAPSSFRRRPKSRRGSRGGRWMAGFIRSHIPAGAGMACVSHWIPRPPVPNAALPPTSM